MSLKIDEYLSASQAITEMLKNQTTSQNVSAQETASDDKDSYVSTIGSSDAAMPSENYNDILKVIQKTKSQSGQSQGGATSGGAGQTGQASGTGASGQTEQTSGAGAAGGAGGGGESEDETTTTTKTVVLNGVTYLETTTVENGVTSVQRTAISGTSIE